ncbi:hypothetical protein C1H46_010800 [Malus baccata]|uniref:Uncharacterized protein n=1 Tax=Malus baccata TaxID=106549 RepID=A0A540MXG3_MALBA|nr:hypothetical protein C1H46_010800 [Malus baccata]
MRAKMVDVNKLAYFQAITCLEDSDLERGLREIQSLRAISHLPVKVKKKKFEVVGKQGRGRPPRARVLKTEAVEEPVEEKLARQVSTRQTRSSRIEELRKIPGTARTSTVSDAGGGDGLRSIP